MNEKNFICGFNIKIEFWMEYEYNLGELKKKILIFFYI